MTWFADMARNNAWANETLYGVVKGMDEAAVWAERPSYFGSLGATLNHITLVDLYYLDALEGGGRGRALFTREDQRDMTALAAEQAALDERLIAVCEALDAGDPARPIFIERLAGPVEERADHTIFHLVQHQVHHRGQAHGLISQAGIVPPQLDDFWLSYGRVPSAAAWWEGRDA